MHLREANLGNVIITRLCLPDFFLRLLFPHIFLLCLV
jgi:hypothetical protein